MAYTRVIRGKINRSESLSRVSMGAELLFRALLHECDDFGRLDCRLRIIHADVYALRDGVSTEDVEFWLVELEQEDLIRRYDVEGHPYALITNWNAYQSGKRSKTPKYPAPEGELLCLSERVQSSRICREESGVLNPGKGYGVRGKYIDIASDPSDPPPSVSKPPSGKDPKVVLPDPFPAERALAEWVAAADGLPPQARGSPDRAAAWAVGNVRAWTEAEGSPAACRKRTLRGWTKTIQNAIRKGWALDGFSEAETERTRALVAEYESRHSGQHMTPEQIEKDLRDPRVRSMLI